MPHACPPTPLPGTRFAAVGISVFSDDAATLRVMAPAGPADVAAMMDAIDALCATGSTNLQVSEFRSKLIVFKK